MTDDLRSVMELVLTRDKLGDDDPERGHADMDAMCEMVVRMTAAGDPDARNAAIYVDTMLRKEEEMGWGRWYA